MSAIGVALSGAASGGAHATIARKCVIMEAVTYCEVAPPVVTQRIDSLTPIAYPDVEVAPFVGFALVAFVLIAGLIGAAVTLAEDARNAQGNT